MSIPEFRVRFGLGALVGGIALVAYRTIQLVVADRAVLRETCWTWTWLPFHAAWLGPYLLMFPLVGLPWFMLPEIGQVRRFFWCALGVAACGWVGFLTHPTACARPAAVGQPAPYQWMLAVDLPNNCLPCLHAAFSVLAAGALAGDCAWGRRAWGRVLLGLTLAAISVSIVALRQHTDLDTVAGLGLGAAGLAAYRGWPVRRSAATTAGP
jgi:hypothetical protein